MIQWQYKYKHWREKNSLMCSEYAFHALTNVRFSQDFIYSLFYCVFIGIYVMDNRHHHLLVLVNPYVKSKEIFFFFILTEISITMLTKKNRTVWNRVLKGTNWNIMYRKMLCTHAKRLLYLRFILYYLESKILHVWYIHRHIIT